MPDATTPSNLEFQSCDGRLEIASLHGFQGTFSTFAEKENGIAITGNPTNVTTRGWKYPWTMVLLTTQFKLICLKIGVIGSASGSHIMSVDSNGGDVVIFNSAT